MQSMLLIHVKHINLFVTCKQKLQMQSMLLIHVKHINLFVSKRGLDLLTQKESMPCFDVSGLGKFGHQNRRIQVFFFYKAGAFRKTIPMYMVHGLIVGVIMLMLPCSLRNQDRHQLSLILFSKHFSLRDSKCLTSSLLSSSLLSFLHSLSFYSSLMLKA